MKEIPLLFSAPMVLALLNGSKTMTRRVVKDNGLYFYLKFIESAGVPLILGINQIPKRYKRPYAIGDLIWVREAFQPRGYTFGDEGEFLIHYPADQGCFSDFFQEQDRENIYSELIDKEITKLGIKLENDGSFPGGECPLRVRPGIHMFKEFSRIWLQITDVRIERLFSITEADAIAEGVEGWPSAQIPGRMEYRNYLKKGDEGNAWGHSELSAQNSFLDLWEAINGKESVNSNPFVWVISFKTVSTNGRPATADQEAAKA